MRAVCEFTVWGPPVAWQRAIPVREGRKVSMKLPAKSRDYQALVRNMANLRLPRGWPMDARYKVLVQFTGKGDYDNYLKQVGDALNETAWNDDSQIDDGHGIRLRGGKPRLEVTIEVIP